VQSIAGTGSGGSPWRCLGILVAAILYLSSMTASVAQTAAGVQATGSSDLVAKKEVAASLTHSAVKTATLKLASTAVSMALFYGGTGNLADAGMLSVISGAGSSALFAVNDYLWDYFSPNTNIAANNESFDPLASAWRNTRKYLTVKPTLIAFGYGVVYWYTGSWSSALTLGTASIFAFPVAFYGNNMAWDWYDWYSASGETSSDVGAPVLQTGAR
jgi:uncharacterized membrane protein